LYLINFIFGLAICDLVLLWFNLFFFRHLTDYHQSTKTQNNHEVRKSVTSLTLNKNKLNLYLILN